MTKYTKIEQMAQRSALTKLFLGPLRLASGQKFVLAEFAVVKFILCLNEEIPRISEFAVQS